MRSDRALREPLLPLLIDTEWPGGRLLREYTVMLDPPPTVAQAAPSAAAPAPARGRVAAAVPAAPAARVRAPAASTTTRPSDRSYR